MNIASVGSILLCGDLASATSLLAYMSVIHMLRRIPRGRPGMSILRPADLDFSYTLVHVDLVQVLPCDHCRQASGVYQP